MSDSQYSFVEFSDVPRDGLGLEMVDANREPVAEVFRCDEDHTFVVSTFGNEISVPDLERLIDRAKELLADFEDGTPLSGASRPLIRPSTSGFGPTAKR